MARANNGGWDFVKEGEIYQYKEDSWIAMVTVMKNNSTDEHYAFDLRVEKASKDYGLREFDIMNVKGDSGYYSGMLQLYKTPEYTCTYKYEREKELMGSKITKNESLDDYSGKELFPDLNKTINEIIDKF